MLGPIRPLSRPLSRLPAAPLTASAPLNTAITGPFLAASIQVSPPRVRGRRQETHQGIDLKGTGNGRLPQGDRERQSGTNRERDRQKDRKKETETQRSRARQTERRQVSPPLSPVSLRLPEDLQFRVAVAKTRHAGWELRTLVGF